LYYRHSFDYTAIAPSITYNGSAFKNCQVTTVRSDGSAFYFVSGSFLWQIVNTSADVYYSAVQGSTIADYRFRGPESTIIVVDSSSGRDLVFVSRNALERVVPLPFPSIYHWTVAMQDQAYLGSIFFSVSDVILGIGFGSPNNITRAREPIVDYYFVQTTSIVDGPGHTVLLAVTVGDEYSIEATRIILWDYTGLQLPLPVIESPESDFVFSDFIIALTRVKNQIYAAFDQPEISHYSPWVPTDWSETDGLAVGVDFTDGTKPEVIDAVLNSIAGVIHVWTERECGFRDYLICKDFVISFNYGPRNETRKRDVPIDVVFMVNGGELAFAGSMALFLVGLLTSLLFTE